MFLYILSLHIENILFRKWLVLKNASIYYLSWHGKYSSHKNNFDFKQYNGNVYFLQYGCQTWFINIQIFSTIFTLRQTNCKSDYRDVLICPRWLHGEDKHFIYTFIFLPDMRSNSRLCLSWQAFILWWCYRTKLILKA